MGNSEEGSEAASMPRALAVVTRIWTADFSPSAPTTTDDCSRTLFGLGGVQLGSPVVGVPPRTAFSLATALPLLFLGSEFGEYIFDASKGAPAAVLANFNHDDKYAVASSARFASGYCHKYGKKNVVSNR